LEFKKNPQLIAMGTAFIEVLREFVPKELFQTAFLRFGAMTGMVDQRQEEAQIVGDIAQPLINEPDHP
jgi:hypothetical protein